METRPPPGRPKSQLHAAALVEQRAVVGPGRQLAAEAIQHAMHDRDVVHERRQEPAAQRARTGLARRAAGGLAQLGRAGGSRLLAQRGRQIVRPGHRQVRHERLVIGIVDLDGDQLHLLDARGQQLEGALVGGIVPLHVGDLDDAAGAIAGGGDAVAAGHGERQRLLAHHVQPGLERRHRQLRMERIGRCDDERIELAGQQPRDIGVHLGKAIALLEGRAHRRRRVGQRHEGEAFALFPQIKGVLGLPYQARPDQPHSEFFHCFLLHWNVPTRRQ